MIAGTLGLGMTSGMKYDTLIMQELINKGSRYLILYAYFNNA